MTKYNSFKKKMLNNFALQCENPEIEDWHLGFDVFKNDADVQKIQKLFNENEVEKSAKLAEKIVESL